MLFSPASVVRFGTVGAARDRRNERVVGGDAASSGLRPTREVSNRLRPFPTVSALRALLAVPWRQRARSMLHAIVDRRGGVATGRHGRMKSRYAPDITHVKKIRTHVENYFQNRLV